MRNARILFGLLLFIFPVFNLAQNADEAAKEKLRRQNVLLEQILVDAKNLRLPENKAFIYAKIGNALWSSDEKRARQLFQNSIGELIAAQIEAEAEKGGKQYFQNLIYGQQPRWDILNLMVSRDAEFALEAMVKTRPARIAQAVINFADDNSSMLQHYARAELQNEQRLLGIAAEQNPERAIKLVRESLKKGVSYETLNLLNKIHRKDAETANKIAEEVGQKFLEMDFASGYEQFNILSYFFSEVAREKAVDEKALKISDNMIRDLAAKMIGYWLNPNMKAFYGNSSFSLVEKIFPERAARVKQKFDQLNNQSQPSNEEYNKLMQSDASAAELVRQAEKLPRWMRNEVYRKAAQKLADGGNISQAEMIFTENLSEEEADNYLSQFNSNLANQAISQGKFEEASAIADRIPNENYRLSVLTYLANSIYQKNPKENQKWALSVLDRARAGISDSPESYEEINLLLNLASAYTSIEPARAFSLIESLIVPLNEISQANAVLAKFRGYGNARQGEFQISGGQNSFGVSGLENVLQTLKTGDFERVVRFTDSFSRLDTRISLQLQLVDENLPVGITSRNVMIKSSR